MSTGDVNNCQEQNKRIIFAHFASVGQIRRLDAQVHGMRRVHTVTLSLR